MEKMEQTSADCNPELMDHTLNDLKRYVERAAQQGLAAHTVEADIWRRVLRLGHQALDLLFQLVGSGDVGETTALPGSGVRSATSARTCGAAALPRAASAALATVAGVSP